MTTPKPKSLIEFLKEYWVIIFFIGTLVMNYGLFSFRIDRNENALLNHEERIKNVELRLERQSVLLEKIDISLNALILKMQQYDDNIKKFYQEYELKKRSF